MKAIFAGSFDLFTIEHEYVARMAAKMFDDLILMIAVNPDKKYFFTKEERVKIAENCLSDLENVYIVYGSGLVFEAAKLLGADILVRGLRYTTEYEYELRLATGNLLVGEIPTVGIFPRTLSTSSSDVRLLINNNSDLWKRYVNPNAHTYISGLIEHKKILGE